MNSLIQKKLEEAQKLYNRYSNGSVRVVPEAIEAFLTTALQEALIAGLELAEGAVPRVAYDGLTMENGIDRLTTIAESNGWNQCRCGILDEIEALKKEVMEGKV